MYKRLKLKIEHILLLFVEMRREIVDEVAKCKELSLSSTRSCLLASISRGSMMHLGLWSRTHSGCNRKEPSYSYTKSSPRALSLLA